MAVERKGAGVNLRIHQGPPENSCRPAVDVLFRSVAEIYGPHALAIVLTGMGQDGLRGCQVIKEAGGQVMVQDEATSVVWGMPGFVARAGLADAVLPLNRLAGEIRRRVEPGAGTLLVPRVSPPTSRAGQRLSGARPRYLATLLRRGDRRHGEVLPAANVM